MKKKSNKNLLFWAIFAAFAVAAVAVEWHQQIAAFSGGLGIAKLFVWAAFFLFVAYSYYCSTQENIFKTIEKMGALHWGRQIGIDLYIGVGLSLVLIYLNEGSIWVLLFWLLPMLLFANLATLLYVALNVESLAAHF